MRKILAISSLAISTAVRSRFFVSLLMLLLLILIGLPFAVKGDGTATGRVRILLSYTLGLSAVILGIASLWASCGSMSQEIENKQIRLVAVKPVSRFQVWFGKWLGLVLVEALLLSVVGAVVCALVFWNTRQGQMGATERAYVNQNVLSGRFRITPRINSVDKQVGEYVDAQMSKNNIRPGMRDILFREVKEQALVSQFSVAPGEYREWFFEVPEINDRDQTAMFRFSFSASFRNRDHVTGKWSIRMVGSPESFNFPVEEAVSGPYVFMVPSRLLSSGERRGGEERVMVARFTNADKSVSHSAVFDYDGGMELLVKQSRFGPNLSRTLVIILCYMCLLTALGLTAGSVFSFPVATFAAASLIVIASISNFFVTSSIGGDSACGGCESSEDRSAVYAVGETIIRLVDTATAPVMSLNPIGLMSDGILVSWRSTLKAVALMGMLYPAVFGLIGNCVLKRRELAK